MCMYSLLDRRNTRNAKVGETLTKGEYRHHAAFLTDEGSIAPMLACIKHGTTLRIDNMQFDPGCKSLNEKYGGQAMTVTFIDANHKEWRRRNYAADCIQMPDGYIVSFVYVADGVTVVIPRKVRKDKGVAKPRNLNKVLGLDQIVADLPPDPKPGEDAPSTPVEPVNPVKEPAKEPAPETTAVPRGWDKVEA